MTGGRAGTTTAARRAVAVVGVAIAGTGLVACSGDSVPAQDEYAGREASSTPSQDGEAAYWAGDGGEETRDDVVPGPYADGTYTTTKRYGPINEDSVEVTLTLENEVVTGLTVTGSALLPQSADYQSAFVAQIEGVVVGRDLEDLDVDVVAGASKTTATFNRALDDIREQAAGAVS